MLKASPLGDRSKRFAVIAIALVAAFLAISLKGIWAEPLPDKPVPEQITTDDLVAIFSGLHPIKNKVIAGSELDDEGEKLLAAEGFATSAQVRKQTEADRKRLAKMVINLHEAAERRRDTQQRVIPMLEQERIKWETENRAGRNNSVMMVMAGHDRIARNEEDEADLTRSLVEALQVYVRKHTQIQKLDAALTARDRALTLWESVLANPKQQSAKFDEPATHQRFLKAQRNADEALAACLSDPLSEGPN